jgi:hypothetical protein
MKTKTKSADPQVRAGRSAPQYPFKSRPIRTHSGRPFDAVAFAAALEVLG